MTLPPAWTAASPLTPDRTQLRAASLTLDHRTHAFRRDLADIALADRVIAAHYARAAPMDCAVAAAPLRAEPRAEASPISELLWGERFDVLELSGGWAWGRCAQDGYVGYVSVDALGPALSAPTHRVGARLALLFAAPSIKAAVVARLPMGAVLRAGAEEGAFLQVGPGWAHMRHVADAGHRETDPVAVAEKLVGAPYGWGGRSEAGVDCSGLVQVALQACGVSCPRDSDQQRETVGQPVDRAAPLRRGDLVFFPGHVGLMADPTNLLHANAFWMSTILESLADVVARLKPQHAQPVVAVRRL